MLALTCSHFKKHKTRHGIVLLLFFSSSSSLPLLLGMFTDDDIFFCFVLSQLTCYSILSLIRFKSLCTHCAGKTQLLLPNAHKKLFKFISFLCMFFGKREMVCVYLTYYIDSLNEIDHSMSCHSVFEKWKTKPKSNAIWSAQKRKMLMMMLMVVAVTVAPSDDKIDGRDEQMKGANVLSFEHVRLLRQLVSIIFYLALF